MVVQETNSGRQLQHQRLDLGWKERFGHVLLQRLEVVFEKVHDQKDIVESVANNNLS